MSHPLVAFLPGAAGSGTFWAPVMARLPAAWERVALDWPGAGAQPHDPAIHSYADLIGLAAAALPDASDVVAQSMGGVVALGLALAHPAKVRRLVLVATSGGLGDQLGEGEAIEDWRAGYRAEFPAAADWVLDERPDFGDALAGVAAPACLIWGDADPISPVAVGERLRGLMPCATLHVIPGADHMLARDRADDVAPVVAAHLS